jgi:molybdenum cofactor cytidylyltransferase
VARAPSFAGVILAAGESSRMGRDKALLPWGEGTFLSAAIRMLQPHVDVVIVVAGKNANALAPVVNTFPAKLTANRHPEQGQFSSLQTGLQAVLDQGRDTAIVALVDRPPADGRTLLHLKKEFLRVVDEEKWAVIPEHDSRHGHPIIVGREMIEAFLRAPAQATARDVEHAHQQRIVYVHVADPRVVQNVDTPEEYDRLAGA